MAHYDKRRQGRHLHGDHPPQIRTVRADGVGLLAVGWKCGPEQTGRPPFQTMTRRSKVCADKEQGSKGEDTEKGKGERVEGYCRHCGNGGTDRKVVVGRDK